MNKRTFLKTGALLGVGGVFASVFPGRGFAAASKSFDLKELSGEGPYELPELPYAYDALEPYIDARTMEIHHTRHHAGYTRKLNAAVKGSRYEGAEIEKLFAAISQHPVAIRNNGGGYWNHKLFWKCMSPDGGGKPEGELLSALEKHFGSFEDFVEKFSQAAGSRFGSGWAWLIARDGRLMVTDTPNQDNPLMDVAEVRGMPLLGLDVWEHAYYLNYQNRRGDYIKAFWNVVNWDYISKRFSKYM